MGSQKSWTQLSAWTTSDFSCMKKQEYQLWSGLRRIPIKAIPNGLWRIPIKLQDKEFAEYPRSRWEFSQKGKERTTQGDQSFQKLIHFLYFSGLLIYFLLYIGMNTESRRVSRPDSCQNQVLYINVYKGFRGFTSSSGHEACWHFMALSDNSQSTRKLIFPRGDFFLNQAPPSK